MKEEVIDLLKKGGVGVLATDTIYGLVGSALKPETVERIYKLRYRDSGKPMIVLIGSLGDLGLFKIKLSGEEKSLTAKLWPGAVSIILNCPYSEFRYLHRGTNTVAFRIPQKEGLINLVEETGPLVAPSANPEGLPPAKTVKEAKNYFADQADFYVDEGEMDGLPSTLVAFEDGKIVVERPGAVDIPSLLE